MLVCVLKELEIPRLDPQMPLKPYLKAYRGTQVLSKLPHSKGIGVDDKVGT
jgi:hypothetical protein